jgi:hypothetical protein
MADGAACPRHERHVCAKCQEKDAGGGALSSSECSGKEGGADEGKAGEAGSGWWSRQSKATKNGLAGAGVAAAVVAVPVVLTVAGFSAAGVVGGSFAAGWQSSIGSVAANSLFATLQSLGALYGVSASAGAGAVAFAGAAGAGVGAARDAMSTQEACKCAICGVILPL